MITSEQAQQAQKLYKQTLITLGEMLKLLKQGDSSHRREDLKSHCDYLSIQGKKQNLFGWVELMETAKVAITRTENNYVSTTKLIIKEIKTASEHLLKAEINAICPSEELEALAPSARARMMDMETVFSDVIPSVEDESEEVSPFEETSPPKKGTLDKDLWYETIFDFEQNSSQDTSDVQDVSPASEEDSDIFDDIEVMDDDISLDDWLDEDSFGDKSDSSMFFPEGDRKATHSNRPLSPHERHSKSNLEMELDPFSSLFDDGNDAQEIKIDQWTSSKEEIENTSEEADWDSIFEDESVEDDLMFLDDESLEDNLELEGELSGEIDYQITVSKESLDLEEISELDDLFDDVARSTVIIDEPESQLEEIITSLDDLDIEDDFPSTGSSDTFQILKPIKSKDVKILYYDPFDELNNFLSSSLLWMENEAFNNLESEIFAVPFYYYEDHSELEKLVNVPTRHIEAVNWQQLSDIVEDLPEPEFHLHQHDSVTVTKSDSPTLSSLSDLDKLLAQADKVKGKKSGVSSSSQKSNAQSKVFDQSMRVSVKQLDNLNNLIGEMVVRRNRLEEDQEKLRTFLDNLLGQVQNLSDVSARMQDLYERSLLEGALMNSRKKNQATVKAQLSRTGTRNTYIDGMRTTNVTGDDGLISNGKKIQTPELDELELDRFTGFHLLSQEIMELIVKVKESTSDIQFLVDETDQLGRNLREVTTQLQEGINKSRMVPFAQNADRLPLPIRKIAEGYNKKVELKLEGREVLIDKMILEHIWDPILQITKNSVTHGIELPEEREALGKPRQGTITVRAFLQGQQTVISVADDGAGIDPQKIKRKAIQNKLVTPDQAQNLKPQDIYDFLFHAGFTTKEQADSHAGRGVGLDIVRSKLNEIRGIVTIDSVIGQGTTFTIRLPLTVTVGKALCCLNDNTRIAFPMDAIEDKRDFNASEIKINAQGQKCIIWNNSLLPFRPLSTLLKFNRQITRSIVYTSNQEEETIPIVILRGGNSLLAIQVDQVLGQEEIVIKQISGPLPKPKGIAGATVRSDGIVMPVADVIELIEIAQGNITLNIGKDLITPLHSNSTTVYNAPVNSQPLILIVDDSITVREMLSMSLSKAGYRFEQARDGQEAWQKLRSGLPCDIVFCDIEMPRMNGLELLQHIQEDPELNHIPVAILSSRGAEKHQRIAAELGASAYLIKPYVDSDLLDSTKRMLEGEVLLPGSTKVPKVKPNKTTRPAAQDSSSTMTKNRGKSAHMVLIIDDSVVVREMLSMTFKKAGYLVEQARDGQDAWDQIRSGLPCDLLLCDIEMPRMNGLELLAKMQQDDQLSKLPVAMVTSRGAEKHRKIAADLGAKAYFTKPYLEEELLKAAKQLIDGAVLL